MPILLHVDSSPMGEASISRNLTREFVRCWRAAHPGAEVISRDLTATAIAPVTAAWVAANYTPAESRTPGQNELLALSTELSRELLRADEYVIGVPMHNWGPAAVFKLWADQIARFGETILLTPSGMKGNLATKKITCFVAAGRSYRAGAEDPSRNHLVPWLRTYWENLGVTDLQIYFIDSSAAVRWGKVSQEEFLAPHLAQVDSLFEQPSLR
jgi:FMN-dependent NADH-azoreductase